MSKDDFVRWWLQTDFGSKKELQDTIYWDGKKSSSYWDQFDQVADEKTGQPKVMCKHCFNILVHPGHCRAGLSPMKAHLKGAACQRMVPRQQRGIDQLIQGSVSIKPWYD
jgi:hypothetical protein